MIGKLKNLWREVNYVTFLACAKHRESLAPSTESLPQIEPVPAGHGACRNCVYMNLPRN